MHRGIIAKNKKNEDDILFVSGYLFQNDIKHIFFESKKDYESIDKLSMYVAIKYYNYLPYNIDIVKTRAKKCKKIFFESKTSKTKYVLLIDPLGKKTEKLQEYKE